ncbi:MAG: DUF4239 domain-containing protein [Candidatus Melainabacteria bacterium]|nr:DUF4239 domain-containing protein [Candidatus Melainabacteria bacterium]
MEITLPNCIGLTIVLVTVSVTVMLFVRRRISIEKLRMHHDVTDPLLAVLGTLFAILLGFMIANAMQRFEEARANVQDEAGAVGDVFRLADGLPSDKKAALRKHCVSYLDEVIGDEFTEMRHNKMSERAWSVYDSLWHDCTRYQPQTEAQNNIHQMLLSSMAKVGECRRARNAQLTYCLPRTLWFILIFGGVSTVVFTYFFAVEDTRLQVAITCVITIVICLNVYMLAGFDSSFSGDIAIGSSAFQTLRSSFLRVHDEAP